VWGNFGRLGSAKGMTRADTNGRWRAINYS
jgi:hypothetical protein